MVPVIDNSCDLHHVIMKYLGTLEFGLSKVWKYCTISIGAKLKYYETDMLLIYSGLSCDNIKLHTTLPIELRSI